MMILACVKDVSMAIDNLGSLPLGTTYASMLYVGFLYGLLAAAGHFTYSTERISTNTIVALDTGLRFGLNLMRVLFIATPTVYFEVPSYSQDACLIAPPLPRILSEIPAIPL